MIVIIANTLMKHTINKDTRRAITKYLALKNKNRNIKAAK